MTTTAFKATLRLFKKHIIRLLTILAIVVVSIGFMSGIGEVEGKIKTSTYRYYQSQNISDFHLKSKNPTGFSADQIMWIEERFSTENAETVFAYETKVDEEVSRIYAIDLEDQHINKLQLIEGMMPASADEILVERKTNFLKERKLGDKVSIEGNQYKICGIVVNPLLLGRIEESSWQYDDHLSNVYYFDGATSPIVGDVYITLEDRTLFKECFSEKYKKQIEAIKQEIAIKFGNEEVVILTLYENFGIYSLCEYAKKVGVIGIVFVVFFLLITLLVVYSTMQRLMSEERPQIACMKTLGFSNFAILIKYVLFVFVAALLGGVVAFPVGYGLSYIIYQAFNLHYTMPAFPKTLEFFYYMMTLIIILFATTLLTYLTGHKTTKEKPAILLTPKAPKSGKKVFMEHIPFIWKRLSFKYKSTVRNVFLFKSRLFMTVLSIMGSAVLVFAGLGLMDCSNSIPGGESLSTIALAIIAFSALLSALVIYNLTNINISERNREVATLMVLGYHNKEVCGYIFREIYIMSFVGALLGLPVGLGFVEFVFGLIDFGTVSQIKWTTYVFTPLIAMAFSFLSTLLLYKKITKIDMNASLKTVE